MQRQSQAESTAERPSLGLYVHFPYCTKRCPYCDFTLTTRPVPHERYLEAVLHELKCRIEALERPQPLVSLYVGGGTPGLWSPSALRGLVEGVGVLLGWPEATPEITLEANPSELTFELASAWREAGFNRLSLGVQSFDADTLTRLGREHSPEQARSAVGWARAAGFDNISVDLIHGLAGRGVEAALADLNAALELEPEHISLYQLTIEPQTAFGARARRGEVLSEPDERLAELYERLAQRLEEAGRPLYEVSNAALPGFEARHNRLYWTLGQYLAVGAGAHGLLWSKRAGQMSGVRWSNERHPERYMSAALSGALNAVEEERHTLSHEALLEEQVLVGLRLFEGFEVSPELRAFVGERAEAQVKAGLLIDEEGRWRASEQGRLLLDALTFKLLT